MLADVATITTVGGSLQGAVGQEWWTPGGPAGGLLSAISLRAAAHAVTLPGTRIRTVAVRLCGELQVGALQIATDRASSAGPGADIDLEFFQDDACVAKASVVFSPPSEPTGGGLLMVPDVEPPSAYPLMQRASWPTVTQHFEYRPVLGPSPRPTWSGVWMTPRVDEIADELAYSLFLDTWYPAEFFRRVAEMLVNGQELLEPPRLWLAEISSVFVAPQELIGRPLGPMLWLNRATWATDGMLIEDGELWTPELLPAVLVRIIRRTAAPRA